MRLNAPRADAEGRPTASAFILARSLDDLHDNSGARGLPSKSLRATRLTRADAIDGDAAARALARIGVRVAPGAASALSTYFAVAPDDDAPLPEHLRVPGGIAWVI